MPHLRCCSICYLDIIVDQSLFKTLKDQIGSLRSFRCSAAVQPCSSPAPRILMLHLLSTFLKSYFCGKREYFLLTKKELNLPIP